MCVRHLGLPLAALLGAAVAAPRAVADTIALEPVADATLVETADGAPMANGAGPFLFAGRVSSTGGGTLRRALLRFDLSGVPANATITAVTLRLHAQSATPAAQTCTLHAVVAAWSEGDSFDTGGGGAPATEGDATWSHRVWPATPWTSPGGDFTAAPCASVVVDGTGFKTCASTPELVAVVQGWVGATASDFGLIIRGNESVLQTTKKFDSRESAEPGQRPLLTVEYTTPSGPLGDLDGDGRVSGADLGILLAAWGATGPGDLDGDGVVGGADLGVLLAHWTG